MPNYPAVCLTRLVRPSWRQGIVLGLCCGASLSSLDTVANQPAALSAADSSDAVRELAPVIVTATRREESLQKIPLAVSSITGAELDKSQKTNLQSIVSEVPSLNFRAGSSNKDTSLFVRGIGTITTSPGVEPSVSTVIDGVVFSRPGQATLDLLDVERIEVLRGPQGTLFGKNASAGVVNIVSKKPTSTPSGFVDVYVTDDDEQRIKLGASGSLIPNVLTANISALLGNYDGNVKNISHNQEVNGYENHGFRSRFDYQASERLALSLVLDYLQKDGTAPTGVVVKNSSSSYASEIAPIDIHAENREVAENTKSSTDDRNQGVSLHVEWTLDHHQISAISAYRRWENIQIQDGDQLSAASQNFAAIADRGTVDTRQISQEIRIKPLDAKLFDYVAGVYFSRNDNDESYRRQSTWYDSSSSEFVSDQGRAVYDTETSNYALFGEGTFKFHPRLRLIAGLRLMHDEISYRHRRDSTVPESVAVRNAIRSSYASHGSSHETGVSGRIGPQFEISPNINSYLTYSRGYKGPAYNVYFNMQSIDTPVLDPETANAYELGLKTQWLDNRLRLNIAAFHTEYQNYQANFRTLDPNGFAITRLVNAGEVSSKGVEVDALLQPNPSLLYRLNIAKIHARIDRFACPAGDSDCVNVDGKPLPFSPDWKINAQIDKYFGLGNGQRIELSGQFSWQSETQYNLDQNDNTIQPSYGIWNASIGLFSPQKDWRLTLHLRNLLDKSYATLLSANGARIHRQVPRDDERYFGLSFRKNF